MRDKSKEDDPIFEEDVDALAKEIADQASSEQESGEQVVTIPAAEYEKLKAELDAAKDRALRALAELENFRNRTNRLAQEERKYAGVDLARDMLPLWDNLGLALSIQEPDKNGQAVVDGVKMVHEEFLKVLSKNGINKIEALHQPFDPKFHESVAFVPSEEFPPNTVVVELKAGFTMHDRVVRAAQVVLASPVPKAEPKEENEQ
ncbi:MAG: nucleotide exchange factor GrpE [Thermoguttaceae bacterium]|nr:nucleotide exchange factor GrpE [Thermoguttaceae bacterium]MBR4751393.1 nucleotide exchange factor GrpE [Thermoguttaceae bacterium]MBR5757816.1 nucleotide exchange factor GrpE [Thermoguttaceae bacterium]